MAGHSPEDDSIGALFARLIDDGERFVRAEVRLYRAQLFSRLHDARAATERRSASARLVSSVIPGCP